jgi:GNAT superfamily N-acetyltransferase
MAETDLLVFREATTADIPALAHLHVVAWRTTYEGVFPLSEENIPTHEIREHQWINAFRTLDNSWFCFVIQDKDTLIGFAKGVASSYPGYDGELNKIYLLKEYHFQGLGRRLMGHVARKFLSHGVSSMLLHTEPRNPSCHFFEKLGAEKLFSEKNEFHGSYGWKDLQNLASVCPI